MTNYFSKVWCEKYYLKNLSTIQQKSLLKFLNSDINNLLSDDAKNSYKALKSIIMTGNVGNFSSTTQTYLDITPRTSYETQMYRTSSFFKLVSIKIPGADVAIDFVMGYDEQAINDLEGMTVEQVIDYMNRKKLINPEQYANLKKLITANTIKENLQGIFTTLDYPEDQYHVNIQTLYKGDDYHTVDFILYEDGRVSIINKMDADIPKVGTGEGIKGKITLTQSSLKKELTDSMSALDELSRFWGINEYKYYETTSKTTFKTP